jgi:hypothetical protein
VEIYCKIAVVNMSYINMMDNIDAENIFTHPRVKNEIQTFLVPYWNLKVAFLNMNMSHKFFMPTTSICSSGLERKGKMEGSGKTYQHQIYSSCHLLHLRRQAPKIDSWFPGYVIIQLHYLKQGLISL